MKRHLFESAELQIEDTQSDTWKVLLITEGRGSSGVYSAELLENYGHAFDDALSFQNHPTEGKMPWDRDLTGIVGEVVGKTWAERDQNTGLMGVWANWRPDPRHRETLERYRGKLGLSIYIEGDGREGANGEYLVESFNADDPYKSVDVVLAAGRGGRFAESMKKSYEALSSEKPGDRSSAQEYRKETHGMDEVEKGLADLTAAVTALVERLDKADESKTQVVEADKVAAERVAKFAEATKAIDSADLFESQKVALKEAAERGEDVSASIESAKTVYAEATKAAEEKSTTANGRVLGEGAYDGPTAWRR